MTLISAITLVFVAAALSAVIIVVLYPVLRRYALARPNARSSHKTPTPQGGGIAVIGTTIAVTCVAADILAQPMAPLAPVFAGIILIAGVGAVDDVRGLAVGPRLVLQSLAIAAILATLPNELRVAPWAPWWIERMALFVGGLWFVNLVNFMDGIDWMSVAEVVPLTAGLVILGYLGALPGDGAIVAAALGGAMIGFAFFNRPVAKLFLGDVGSLPIGLLLAWLLFLVAAGGHLTAAIVMPLYYLADATITLVRRLLRGEPVWQAHRTHFYQRATDHGFTVLEVVAWVFAANVCLCGLAVLTVVVPGAWSDGGTIAASAAIVAVLLVAFTRKKIRAR
jgi:UDP-N-acetylmuramyl pentapeptide phosphotransferase/UDP-N-acetylglucosamine-1-phosphate transferase